MFVRFAVLRLRAAACVCVFATVFAAPAAAQDGTGTAPAATLQDAIDASLEQLAAAQPAPDRPFAAPSSDRPAALVPLYMSYAALQGMDVHSTTRGLNRGAAEANPFLKGVAGNPGALVAVKAASTAGIVYSVERLRKRNRAAAVVLMVGLNAGMAYVVQHNYRMAR